MLSTIADAVTQATISLLIYPYGACALIAEVDVLFLAGLSSASSIRLSVSFNDNIKNS